MNVEITESVIGVHGLPWFDGNAPELYRFPVESLSTLPEKVVTQARFPCGGRLRFTCDTTRLEVCLRGITDKPAHALGVYVDGNFWRRISVDRGEEVLEVIYEDLSKSPRLVEIYLPYRQELRISGIEVDPDARFDESPAYVTDKPVVYYGSSVAQGVGAGRPSMSYEAVLSRMLDADFINFGFGGAGKAEPEVVDLVRQVDACCYVLDLGKSYGLQDYRAYETMLDTILSARPGTPVICMTPIFSAREHYLPEYADLSRHTREVVAEAATGKTGATVVDGLQLLGSGDGDALSGDGTHPTELGFQLIADRLSPVLRGVISA